MGVDDVNHERLLCMTVAEGIELVSGLHFSDPLPAAEAAAYLRQFEDTDPDAPWLVAPQLPPNRRAA